MQESQVYADISLVLSHRLTCYLTGKDDIPGITLSLDRTGFDRACDLSMQLHLDTANLGEADAAILRQGETGLRVGEAVVAALALEAWIARFLTIPHAPEEGIERFLYPSQDILQDL